MSQSWGGICLARAAMGLYVVRCCAGVCSVTTLLWLYVRLALLWDFM